MSRVWIVALLIWLPTATSYADFDTGLDAFNRGDYSTAHELWRQAAEDGDIRAINNLGFMYLNGLGVAYDASVAASYFGKAANEYADPLAMANFGWLLVTGEGGRVSLDEGVDFLKQAAKASVPAAKHYLAILHRSGHGVRRDIAESCRLDIGAAESGHVDALVFAGICIEEGQGAPKNLSLAADYFKSAIEQTGDPGAIVSLGRLVMSGDLGEADYEAAYRLFQKAGPDNPGAAILLGDMHFHGLGIEQDDAAAIAWYEKGLAAIEKAVKNSEPNLNVADLLDASFVTQARDNLTIANNRSLAKPASATMPQPEDGGSASTSSVADDLGGVNTEIEQPKAGLSLTDPETGLPYGFTVPSGSGEQARFIEKTARSPLTERDAKQNRWSLNMPTIHAVGLVAAGVLGALLLPYSLIYLVFKNFLGLAYSAGNFLSGLGLTVLLSTLIRFVLGRSFYDDNPYTVLIPAVTSVAVLVALLLFQRDRPTNLALSGSSEPKQSSSDSKRPILKKRSHQLGGQPEVKNTIQHGIGWMLLILSGLGMVMCSQAGPDMRGFVTSPAGAWVWLVWLAMLIGGVVLKQR